MLKIKRLLCAAAFSALMINTAFSAETVYTFSDLGNVKDTHMDPALTASNGTRDAVLYDKMVDMIGKSYADMMYNDLYKQRLTHGGASFGAYYNNNAYGKSWHGFVSSSETNNAQKGMAGQFTAITGTGVNGSDNYMVYYGDGGGMGIINYTGVETLGIKAENNMAISGMYVTNTAYAYYSMLEGDGYQKTPFQEGDYFKLIIKGFDGDGNFIGDTFVMLGEGTNLLDEWLYVDIESDIGGAIELVSFAFEQGTYDNKTYVEHGCKVPIYAAIGGIAFSQIPEASAYAIFFGIAALACAAYKRRKKAA